MPDPADPSAPPVRRLIADAFEERGGLKGLLDWIDKDDANEKAFYLQIWPKLLGHEAEGEADLGQRLARALTWLPPA